MTRPQARPSERIAAVPGRARSTRQTRRIRLTSRASPGRRAELGVQTGLNIRVDLNEFELIQRLVETIEGARRTRPDAWREEVRLAGGDDAAITVPKGATVTSVDALVEGVHFRRDLAPLETVGRKAIAVALSDLAAMGAQPGEGYVQLGIPNDLDESGCLELAGGLAAAAAEYGVVVIGGDVTRAPALFVAMTVVG